MDHFAPERSDNITLFCRSLQWLNDPEQAMWPFRLWVFSFPEREAFTNFSDGFETMARKFLSHGVSWGCIPLRSLSGGKIGFSSTPFVGGYYTHLGVYLLSN